MSKSIVKGILASAVADDGTFTVSYPSGKDEGHFVMGVGHKIVIAGNDMFEHPAGLFLTFGASNITVKNKSGASWPVNARYHLQLEELGERQYRAGGIEQDRNKAAILPIGAPALVPNTWKGELAWISLGAPDTIDDNGVFESASDTGAHTITLDGALLVGDAVVFDVPRNVVADSGGADTAVLTITGTDVYGNVMVEEITLNGTVAVEGKKAFKTITGVTSDGTITNGAFLGNGDVLGLPVYIPSVDCVLLELEDKTTASAGTFVAGVQTEGGATATDGDVRGTYDPNSACDGNKFFHVVLALPDPKYIGISQYTG